MTEEIPGWPWRPDLCPADLHYGEYLLEHSWAPLDRAAPKVLHVGTGLHHHIGLLLGSHGWHVIGMTVSNAEVEAFEALTNRPRTYIAAWRDVRTPERTAHDGDEIVDSMSLFHLGEPPAPNPWMMSEREVIERALTWSREVVFYTGSAAFDRIEPIIEALCADGKMIGTGTYKTLRAYRPIP